MVQSAEKGGRADGTVVRRFLVATAGRVAIEPLMCSVDVVIVEIIGKDAAEMVFVENNHVIQTLSADRADYSLRVRILPGRTNGRCRC